MATSYYTVENILKSVGALTETEAILPTGTDLNVRIQYINDALGEWADTYTWQDLNKTITFNVNAGQGPLTAMSLPTTFREPLTGFYVTNTTSGIPAEYALIPKSQRFKMQPDDRYSYITGEIMNKELYVNASLASGTIGQMDYMAFPTAVGSISDYVPVTSSQYLVKRVAAMVFQARGDARFPGLQADAQRLLSNAIEEQNVPFGRKNQIPIANSGFTIGVDS
jgi:hypothetical protein